jgi:hypothetical protein
MKICKNCKNQDKKRQCQYYSSMGNYAERCKDFEELYDFDKMMEILRDASISYGYAYDGSAQIKEASYIITQKDMIKLLNYVKLKK